MQTMRVEIAVTGDNSQAWTLRRIRANFNFGQFSQCPINLLKKVHCVLLPPRILQEDNAAVRLEKDPHHWMNAVTPARCMKEQNVEMLRAPDGKIDFRSTREIEAREELRVWCSSSLSRELGIYKARYEDKEGSHWICRQCGVKFHFPNLLSAHVTFTCKGNDVIHNVELQSERQTLVTGGDIQSETAEERHRKPFKSYQDETGDALLVESCQETRGVRRKLSDSRDGPSEVRYVACPSAPEFSFYDAYGLSTALAQQNQRLLNNPKIARLISSFSRPRLLKLSNEPESLAEHQKKEFRKKFQGNEHYLRRHLYRDGGSNDAHDLEKFEDVLNAVDEEGNAKKRAEERHLPNEEAVRKITVRDSNVKYGPFYSSDDFHLALRTQAKASNEANAGSSRFLQPFTSIFNTNHGVCHNEFQGNDQVVLGGGSPDAACTCGSHDNTAFLRNSDKEEVTGAGGTGEENGVVEEQRNGSPGSNLFPIVPLSDASVSSNKNPANHCESAKPFFHGNRYLRLDAFLTTTPTPLPYKLPTIDDYYTVSRFSLQHPEPTLYLDPLYHYSPYQRMLPGILSQSSAQAQARAQGFRCDYCGKAYCRKYVLKIHMRTHTGFKPLQCKVCDKTFSDPSNMKKHVKLHETEDTVHQCPHCGRNFVRYRGLLNHLKSKHA